ncbi:MAG: sigma 54-dependent Fis family transcriptional regulator [Deltaproteobacteria bacterium]|nr:sigma 54-dependent Fis family transcriptional regulator [Deltaproteobacteria bacterium]
MSSPTVSTQPSGAPGFPVRTLRIEVTDGPDAGLSHVAESDTLSIGTASSNEVVLHDATVSRFHVELVARSDGILVIDQGSTNGTTCGPVRIERAVVASGSTLTIGRSTLRVGEGAEVTVELHEGDSLGALVGRTPTMRRLMAQLRRAASSDVPVLLVGESGTGKELAARALHDLGPRADRPFVTVDCGALSPSLVASELFGHEKGAFTGADTQHVGAFERADGGTLFLDEIGELPASLQPALLGALERRRFRRVGGRNEIAVDVRVVSATNRDLRAEVNAGSYRLDLYYRLAVVVLRIPPLRDRPEDVPMLVERFLRDDGHEGPIDAVVPPSRMVALCEHPWPGNVRELRNVVRATLALGELPEMDVPGLGGAPARPNGVTARADAALDGPYGEVRAAVLKDFERRYLRRLLDRAGGNVSKAARDAEMDRSHLAELLKRHGLR